MKSKVKKWFGFACAAVFAVALCCPLLACADKDKDGDGDDGGSSTVPQVPVHETEVTPVEDGVEITLPGDGAEYYDIYKGNSAYGDFTLVETDYEGESYVGDDLWAYYRVDFKANGNVTGSRVYSYEKELFGENTMIFSPEDDPEEVQAVIDEIYEGQRGASSGQFTEDRYALLFEEGSYDVTVYEGYYTSVAGLGLAPTDTKLGGFHVYADLESNNNATHNFWRTVENVTVTGNVQWAVSQATSMRRTMVRGNLTLHQSGGWSSGGFLADSRVTGTVNSGSQQQWISRNDEWNTWSGSNFNMVYVGVEGAIPSGDWPSRRVTDIESTPRVREKPFLVQTEDGYGVFVPDLLENSSGISWDEDGSEGEIVPLDDFYLARADRDDASTINAALAAGKHLILTPGVYMIDEPIEVAKAGTIVLGMGLATLRISDENTDTLMRVSDVDGVILSGILFDAGKNSQTLLEVGEEGASARHSSDPICLSDLFFRVGGHSDEPTYAHTSVVINSSDVIGDNFWVWRADHSHGVGWDTNVTVNGVEVNGDYVTFYGLFVEHYHEYQTIWNGEYGETYFYQSEIPYDPPTQEAYMSHDGTVNGWASYKIADDVQNHRAYGLGVYSCPRQPVKVANAIEAPANPGIYIEHAVTVRLSGADCLESVLNGEGDRIASNMMAINIYSGGTFS